MQPSNPIAQGGDDDGEPTPDRLQSLEKDDFDQETQEYLQPATSPLSYRLC